MSHADGNDQLADVFRAWARGSVGNAEFQSRVFESLSPDNWRAFLTLASPDDLARLKAVSDAAPTDEDGWRRTIRVESWCGPQDDAAAERDCREREASAVRNYRRGVETFRLCLAAGPATGTVIRRPLPNVFADLPGDPSQEVFQTLLTTGTFRVERIVSQGQASPEGFWYDQGDDEWVLLLSGAARLRFEEEDQAVELTPGSFVSIAAHRRHRVEWTDPTQMTVWLAIHYRA